MSNKKLRAAKAVKNDEFYTRLVDIKKELQHYKLQLKGKIVYCNTDGSESNFIRYFEDNFKELGIVQCIATSYTSGGRGIITIIDEYGRVEDSLEGDGDFRSKECVRILKGADVVITNPPFSIFREYIAFMKMYEKKFLIIGNPNALTYKEIFPLFMSNELRLGYKPLGTDTLFNVRDSYAKELVATKKEGSAYKVIDGIILGRAQSCWFTNLATNKSKGIPSGPTYKGNEEHYPKYDNYDAINVDKVSDIPVDYDGAMGVPITFMQKYNPKQFEILGRDVGLTEESSYFYINGRKLYDRVIIKRR